MMFHLSRNPLLEEYAVARQYFNLSVSDCCEIARNSVKQSGFSRATKAEWHGPEFDSSDQYKRNNCARTNVPSVRYHFRVQRLNEERQFVEHIPAIRGKLGPK